MRSSFKHSKRVVDLHKELTNLITNFMKANDLSLIKFNTPFRIFIEEVTYDNDRIMIPLEVDAMFDNGILVTDEDHVILGNLSIREAAHIMDILEENKFSIVELIEE